VPSIQTLIKTTPRAHSGTSSTLENPNNSQDTSLRLARIQLIPDLNTTYLVDICPLQSLDSYIDEDLSRYNFPEYFELEVMPRWWCIPHPISHLISAAGLNLKGRPIGSLLKYAVARTQLAVNSSTDADEMQFDSHLFAMAAAVNENVEAAGMLDPQQE
jgi:hypothetical protein